MLASRQHGDHRIRPEDGVLGRGGSDRALLHGVGNSVGAQIKGMHLMTALDQVGGHAGTHISQSDESDAGHGVSPR